MSHTVTESCGCRRVVTGNRIEHYSCEDHLREITERLKAPMFQPSESVSAAFKSGMDEEGA